MKRKLHTAEQIVNKLRQADAAIASGGIGATLAAILRPGPVMPDQTSQGLSPQKADQAKKIIKTMCKTLPAAAPTSHWGLPAEGPGARRK